MKIYLPFSPNCWTVVRDFVKFWAVLFVVIYPELLPPDNAGSWGLPHNEIHCTKLFLWALQRWLKETDNYSTSDKRVITRHHDDAGVGNWHLCSSVSRASGWKACSKQLPILSSRQWKFKTHIIFISCIWALWTSQCVWANCCPWALLIW